MKHHKYLILLLILPLTALLVLARWNYLQADDLHGHNMRLEFGFWGMQEWIYTMNSGRYTSNFLAALFSQHDALFRYPWLSPIVLITTELLALMLFMRVYFAQKTWDAFLLSLLAFFVHACLLPEPSTALYWFSGSITYQTSIILALLIAAALKIHVGQPHPLLLALIAILLFLAIGTNELSGLIIGGSAILAGWLLFRNGKADKVTLLTITITALLSLSILLLSPGLQVRRSTLPDTSFLNLAAAVPSWTLYTLWELGVDPVFWLMMVAGILLGNSGMLHVKISPRWLALFALIQLASLTLVLAGTNGSIPLRMINVYTVFNAALLFICALVAGTMLQRILKDDVSPRLQSFLIMASVLLVLFSSLSGQIFQSILSAPQASAINKAWHAQLSDAERSGKGFTTLQGYKEGVDSLLDQRQLKKVFRQLAGQPPKLIVFPYSKNDTITINHFMLWYQLDSLRIGDQIYRRPNWAPPPSR